MGVQNEYNLEISSSKTTPFKIRKLWIENFNL